MLTYELDKSRTEPMYIQIYRHIRADVELGDLRAGEKLPSKRSLAGQLGVSVVTVENAYAQLLAEGYICSRPKSGYYVESVKALSGSRAPIPPASEPAEAPPDPVQSLFPFTVWAKLMREELASNQTRLLTRPPAEGVPALRQAIAQHLKSFRNMDVSPEQIIIGAGTEYLYILIKMLLGDRSVIAVEEPGYRKIADIYERLGMRCAWIPMEENGIRLDLLRSAGADVAHISPSHHFPTGCVTSIEKRYALLSWAAEGHYIIEDDYDSEFWLSGRPIPSLFSVDVTDRVIYMNTFSRSLTPTIRISYMILPPPLLERFRERLGCISCAVSTFEQYTLARFIGEGYFEKHIRRVRKRCIDGRTALLERLAALFPEAVVSGANAGMYCVVHFPTDAADEQLLQQVTQEGFRAALLSDDFHEKPDEPLHTLLIHY